jgi:hypothetical protein
VRADEEVEMRRLVIFLSATVLVVVAGCTAAGSPSFASSATDEATGSYPLDMPSGKLEALQEAGNWTMPPVQGTPIPWLDRAYNGPLPTDTPDPAAGLPTCSAAQIEISFAGWDDHDELGSVGWVVARNTGNVACIITGPPQIDLLDGGGRALATDHGGDGPTAPAVLRPGLPAHPTGPLASGALGPQYTPGYGYGEVRVNGYCDSATTLRVKLPNGAGRDLAIPPQPAARCVNGPGDVMTWFLESVDRPQPTTFSADSLLAFVSLPDEVVVGQPFHFTVALQNDSVLPVSLDPCPVYTIQVTAAKGPHELDSQTSHEYALNCDSVATIPIRTAVAFDMEALVPAGTPLTDTAYVSWLLGTADRPTGAAMTKDKILKLRAP